MCGIAGFLGSPGGDEAPEDLLARMIGALRHRGPDDGGVHVEDGIGLAHARLSIIDLATGQQPMSTGDGDLWITFNGEIFNYLELRRELADKGCRFRTTSDTEVILELYRAHGAACVERLNGDFAFAFWDRRRRLFMLARDRMGVRPLYMAHRNQSLFFASEVKALLAVPGITAELDPIALDQTFTLWSPIAPRTPFKNILELPPAHILVAQGGKVSIRPYWQLDFPDEGDEPSRNEASYAEELRDLLTDATRIRMRSDVPVGSYLSGGLDSSIIATLAKDLAPDRLRTFSVSFDIGEFDESAHQATMVQALGTEHEAIRCDGSSIASSFSDVIRHAERPVLRTAPAPLFALSHLVRDRGFKVVLTGEGADEILAGYDIFKEAKIRRFCARVPGSRLRPLLLRRLYPYLPALQGQSQKYLETFFGGERDRLDDPLFGHLPRFRNTAAAKMFFSSGLQESLQGYDALEELRGRLPASFAKWHPLSQAQYLETTYLLPGYILSSQGDRMAMAHGVEGRFPFLDHRVVEFASRIPPHLKLKGLREKHILRKSMEGRLPASIGARTKQPYRAPDSRSFSGPTAPVGVAEALSRSEIAAAGYFNPRAVEKLVAKNQRQPLAGFRDNAAFVGILSTQLWHRAFVRKASPMPFLSALRTG